MKSSLNTRLGMRDSRYSFLFTEKPDRKEAQNNLYFNAATGS